MQPGAGERKSASFGAVLFWKQYASRSPPDSLKNTWPVGLSSQAELEVQRCTLCNKIKTGTDSFTKFLAIFISCKPIQPFLDLIAFKQAAPRFQALYPYYSYCHSRHGPTAEPSSATE